MTKSAATPVVDVVAPASVPTKPFSIDLIGPAHVLFQQAIVHARQGYTFVAGTCPQFFPANGTVMFQMVLGEPEKRAEQLAAETIEAGNAKAHADYLADVQRAARQMVLDEKKAALEADMKAKEAEATKAIKRLKDELAASQAAFAASNL